jgi:SOS response regulatory protein OraA/RecX
LKERGIDESMARDAIAKAIPNPKTNAARVIKQRFPNFNLDDLKEKQRAVGFLARRGFETDMAKEVLGMYSQIR